VTLIRRWKSDDAGRSNPSWTNLSEPQQARSSEVESKIAHLADGNVAVRIDSHPELEGIADLNRCYSTCLKVARQQRSA
jgi:hypothetical protein